MQRGDAYKQLIGGTYKDYNLLLAQQAHQAMIALWHQAHNVSQTDLEKYWDYYTAFSVYGSSAQGRGNYGADEEHDGKVQIDNLYSDENIEEITGFTIRMLIDKSRRLEESAQKQMVDKLRAYPDGVDLKHPEIEKLIDMSFYLDTFLYRSAEIFGLSHAQAEQISKVWKEMRGNYYKQKSEEKPEDHQCARMTITPAPR